MKTFDFFFDKTTLALKNHKHECISSICFGLLCYGYYYSNMIYNQDCMYNLIIPMGYSEIGRWGTDLMSLLFTHPTMPWYDGLISLLLFTLGICLICNIFELKNKYIRIILAGLIISFPSIANDYLFMYQAIHYSLAFLLAIIPIFYLKKKSDWSGITLSVLCIAFLLSLYQGSLAVTSSLIIIFLIKSVLYDNNKDIDVIKKGLLGLAIMVSGIITYFLITKAIFVLTNSNFNETVMNRMNEDISFLDRFKSVYTHFFQDLFKRGHKLCYSKTNSILHLIIICCSLFYLTFKMRALSVTRVTMISLLIILIPLSINFMYLAVNPDAIHALVLIGYISIYVFVATIIDKDRPKFHLKDIAKISMCIILFLHIRTANVVAMKTKYMYENAFSFYTTLVTQIKSSGLLDDKSRLAICGQADDYLYDFKDYPPASGLCGGGVNNYSKQNFIKYYIGFDIPRVYLSEKMEIVKTKEFQDMPIYPYQGSIKKIGDVIVVKLSEEVNDSH